MTKAEYGELFDRLSYGHDADLLINGHRYFFEWITDGLAIYKMTDDIGEEVAIAHGENKIETVKNLFKLPLLEEKSIDNSYAKMEILDIE